MRWIDSHALPSPTPVQESWDWNSLHMISRNGIAKSDLYIYDGDIGN
jgi:hypothetical protein